MPAVAMAAHKFSCFFAWCVFPVGRHHRDGRAEQTHSHLPGLPCHGAEPEQLAEVRMDPETSCTAGLNIITHPEPRSRSRILV